MLHYQVITGVPSLQISDSTVDQYSSSDKLSLITWPRCLNCVTYWISLPPILNSGKASATILSRRLVKLFSFLYFIMFSLPLWWIKMNMNLSHFLCDVMFDVCYDRQFVAMFRRRHVTVSVAFLQRPLQVMSNVARERRPTASVVDCNVPDLGQVKPHLGRVHWRTVRPGTHGVIRMSIAGHVGIKAISRPEQIYIGLISSYGHLYFPQWHKDRQAVYTVSQKLDFWQWRSQILIHFQNSFTARKRIKFPTKRNIKTYITL